MAIPEEHIPKGPLISSDSNVTITGAAAFQFSWRPSAGSWSVGHAYSFSFT